MTHRPRRPFAVLVRLVPALLVATVGSSIAVAADAPAPEAPAGRAAAPATEPRDTVVLRDGTRHEGTVVELGGNRIDLLLPGGARKVLKRDIETIEFSTSRHRKTVGDTDLIVRQGGHQIRGKVEVLKNGEIYRVTLPGGSTAEIPRRDVLQFVPRGQEVLTDTTTYTVELGAGIEQAIAVLSGALPAPGPAVGFATPAAAEEFLARCGILAISRVREALAKADAASEGATALARVERLHGLKEVTASDIEEAASTVYATLAGDDLRAKLNLLLLVLPRFVDQSVPLARFLAKDALQEPVVRAWAIDFLRRMQKNRELVEIYRESSGQIQLAAAVALGRNQILFGIPTLLEAMEIDLPGSDGVPPLRELAAKSIQEITRKDFGFRPDAAPQARRAALAKWQAWWQENREALTKASESVLRSEQVETESRQAAVKLWMEATGDIDAGKLEIAELKLRRARELDPTFQRASIGLAVLLYKHVGKVDEAIEILEGLREQPASATSAVEREWTLLHLGSARALRGEHEKAVEAYRQCRMLDSDNIEATAGLGDSSYAVAVSSAEIDRNVRKDWLDMAWSAYESALGLLDQRIESLTTLRPEDVPAQFELLYDRRGHNRSVLELRDRYRVRKFEVVFGMARIRALRGETEEAMKSLRLAVEDMAADASGKLDPTEAAMRTYLAVLYEKLERPLLAFREYRRVLDDIDPKDPTCLRAIERLRGQMQRKPAPDER